jgi:hypothetical protein
MIYYQYLRRAFTRVRWAKWCAKHAHEMSSNIFESNYLKFYGGLETI